ncbi:hypothetical protein CDIK_0369 [Cucumispora dikerogammari]|nr:hypothetical protein CDIK_0369 [Cucumispora dikerogammari]
MLRAVASTTLLIRYKSLRFWWILERITLIICDLRASSYSQRPAKIIYQNNCIETHIDFKDYTHYYYCINNLKPIIDIFDIFFVDTIDIQERKTVFFHDSKFRKLSRKELRDLNVSFLRVQGTNNFVFLLKSENPTAENPLILYLKNHSFRGVKISLSFSGPTQERLNRKLIKVIEKVEARFAPFNELIENEMCEVLGLVSDILMYRPSDIEKLKADKMFLSMIDCANMKIDDVIEKVNKTGFITEAVKLKAVNYLNTNKPIVTEYLRISFSAITQTYDDFFIELNIFLKKQIRKSVLGLNISLFHKDKILSIFNKEIDDTLGKCVASLSIVMDNLKNKTIEATRFVTFETDVFKINHETNLLESIDEVLRTDDEVRTIKHKANVLDYETGDQEKTEFMSATNTYNNIKEKNSQKEIESNKIIPSFVMDKESDADTSFKTKTEKIKDSSNIIKQIKGVETNVETTMESIRRNETIMKIKTEGKKSLKDANVIKPRNKVETIEITETSKALISEITQFKKISSSSNIENTIRESIKSEKRKNMGQKQDIGLKTKIGNTEENIGTRDLTTESKTLTFAEIVKKTKNKHDFENEEKIKSVSEAKKAASEELPAKKTTIIETKQEKLRNYKVNPVNNPKPIAQTETVIHKTNKSINSLEIKKLRKEKKLDNYTANFGLNRQISKKKNLEKRSSLDIIKPFLSKTTTEINKHHKIKTIRVTEIEAALKTVTKVKEKPEIITSLGVKTKLAKKTKQRVRTKKVEKLKCSAKNLYVLEADLELGTFIDLKTKTVSEKKTNIVLEHETVTISEIEVNCKNIKTNATKENKTLNKNSNPEENVSLKERVDLRENASFEEAGGFKHDGIFAINDRDEENVAVKQEKKIASSGLVERVWETGYVSEKIQCHKTSMSQIETELIKETCSLTEVNISTTQKKRNKRRAKRKNKADVVENSFLKTKHDIKTVPISQIKSTTSCGTGINIETIPAVKVKKNSKRVSGTEQDTYTKTKELNTSNRETKYQIEIKCEAGIIPGVNFKYFITLTPVIEKVSEIEYDCNRLNKSKTHFQTKPETILLNAEEEKSKQMLVESIGNLPNEKTSHCTKKSLVKRASLKQETNHDQKTIFITHKDSSEEEEAVNESIFFHEENVLNENTVFGQENPSFENKNSLEKNDFDKNIVFGQIIGLSQNKNFGEEDTLREIVLLGEEGPANENVLNKNIIFEEENVSNENLVLGGISVLNNSTFSSEVDGLSERIIFVDEHVPNKNRVFVKKNLTNENTKFGKKKFSKEKKVFVEESLPIENVVFVKENLTIENSITEEKTARTENEMQNIETLTEIYMGHKTETIETVNEEKTIDRCSSIEKVFKLQAPTIAGTIEDSEHASHGLKESKNKTGKIFVITKNAAETLIVPQLENEEEKVLKSKTQSVCVNDMCSLSAKNEKTSEERDPRSTVLWNKKRMYFFVWGFAFLLIIVIIIFRLIIKKKNLLPNMLL